MTIVTKGMGAVLKSIKGLKKSKKFPGPKAEPKLVNQWKKRKAKGERVTSEHVATDPRMDRIHRTKSRRSTTALKIKEFRKNKGRFTGATSNVAGSIQKSPFYKPGSKVVQRGPMAVLLKAGNKKKDLRKFKTQIKGGRINK